MIYNKKTKSGKMYGVRFIIEENLKLIEDIVSSLFSSTGLIDKSDPSYNEFIYKFNINALKHAKLAFKIKEDI